MINCSSSDKILISFGAVRSNLDWPKSENPRVTPYAVSKDSESPSS